MKSWFSALGKRDRNALLLALVVVSLFSLWRLVLEPMQSRVDKLQSSVLKQEDDLQWMRHASRSISQLSASKPRKLRSRGGQSLLALVDQSARIKGLGSQMRRAEPAGERRVRVTLEMAPFDSLVKWTESLYRNYALMTVDVTLDESGQAGFVNARVTFEDPAGQ